LLTHQLLLIQPTSLWTVTDPFESVVKATISRRKRAVFTLEDRGI